MGIDARNLPGIDISDFATIVRPDAYHFPAILLELVSIAHVMDLLESNLSESIEYASRVDRNRLFPKRLGLDSDYPSLHRIID